MTASGNPDATADAIWARIRREMARAAREELVRLLGVAFTGGVGASPTAPGIAAVTVQSEGTEVASVPTLNFGPGFVVAYDAANNRVDIDLDPDFAALNVALLDDAGDVFVDDAGVELTV